MRTGRYARCETPKRSWESREPSGCQRPLASCLRSKDSRAVLRGAEGKGRSRFPARAYEPRHKPIPRQPPTLRTSSLMSGKWKRGISLPSPLLDSTSGEIMYGHQFPFSWTQEYCGLSSRHSIPSPFSVVVPFWSPGSTTCEEHPQRQSDQGTWFGTPWGEKITNCGAASRTVVANGLIKEPVVPSYLATPVNPVSG